MIPLEVETDEETGNVIIVNTLSGKRSSSTYVAPARMDLGNRHFFAVTPYYADVFPAGILLEWTVAK